MNRDKIINMAYSALCRLTKMKLKEVLEDYNRRRWIGEAERE